MNIQTLVVLTKGWCMCTMPTIAAVGAGLPELNLPTIFGVPIRAWVLACSIYGVFAGAVLAWLSSSASDLLKKNGNGAPAPEVKP
jgi:hypothetical protein